MVSGSISADCQFAKRTDGGVSGRFGRSFGPKTFDGDISLLNPALTPAMRLGNKSISGSCMRKT